MKNPLPLSFRFLLFFMFMIPLSGTTTLKAQRMLFGIENVDVEIGVNVGPTFFLGDLGGKVGKGTTFIKDLNYEFTKMMKGVYVNVYPSSWYGLRLAGQLTYLEGDDAIISTYGVDELWRKQRNLNFRSNVWEVYSALEFYPLDFINRGNEDYYGRFKPYFFGGVGVYHFNPMGSMVDGNGNTVWQYLQPLRTEGQGFSEYPDRKEYKLTQMNMPYGAGFKYLIGENVHIGMELLYRKTFTDYLDDVSTTYIDPAAFDANLSPSDAYIARQISDKSVGIVTPGMSRYAPGVQRGNPRQDDAYFSLLFKCGVRLGNGGYAGASERNAAMRTRCPARF